MHAALRPYVTAGVALVGSSVIAVTPIVPSQPEALTADWNVSLAAAATDTPNLSNISANLFIALANAPYNFLNALGAGDVNLGSEPNSGFSFQPSYDGVSLDQTEVVGLTSNLNYAGNWWVYSPTNVLGTDAGDITRYQALMNLLIPFPALSVPLGNMWAAAMASLLPMNVGCTGTGAGACPDPIAILSTMFNLAHLVALFSPGGYTFPAVNNPITCDADGQCDIADENGPALPWSQQNVQLDPSAPFTNFYNSLNATPDFSAIHIPSFQMVVDTFMNFLSALNTAFNPFVLGTQCGLCAPFVPNPGGEPVPGPVFPDATTSDVTTLAAAGGDVAQDQGPGTEVQKDVADTATTNTLRALDMSSQKKTVVAEPDQGLVTTAVDAVPAVDAAPAVEKPEPTTATSTTVILDGNKVVPEQTGPKHRNPSGGGLSDAMKSVRNTISKVTEGLKGGDTANAGEADTGSEGGSANASN